MPYCDIYKSVSDISFKFLFSSLNSFKISSFSFNCCPFGVAVSFFSLSINIFLSSYQNFLSPLFHIIHNIQVFQFSSKMLNFCLFFHFLTIFCDFRLFFAEFLISAYLHYIQFSLYLDFLLFDFQIKCSFSEFEFL